ncbi:hypothetical protein V8C34DRAFT_208380 [Trichoderma compactum]
MGRGGAWFQPGLVLPVSTEARQLLQTSLSSLVPFGLLRPASSTPAGIARPIGGSRCHGSLPQTIQTIVSDPRVRGTWGTGETWGTSMMDGIAFSLAASRSRPPSLIITTIKTSIAVTITIVHAGRHKHALQALGDQQSQIQCRIPPFNPPHPLQ